MQGSCSQQPGAAHIAPHGLSVSRGGGQGVGQAGEVSSELDWEGPASGLPCWQDSVPCGTGEPEGGQVRTGKGPWSVRLEWDPLGRNRQLDTRGGAD